MTPAPDTVVIGIGNDMRRDDGVGHAAIKALIDPLGDSNPAVELALLDGEPTRLVEHWRDRDLAVVVDAISSGAPCGTIHRYEVGIDALPPWQPGPSSHAAGLAEAIDLARVVDRLPNRLVIIGVEPGDVGLGPGLSPEVAAALPEAVALVRQELAI